MTSFIQDAAQPNKAPLIGTMPASGNVVTLDDAQSLKYLAASRGNGQERIQEGLEGEAPPSPADESGIYQEVLYSAPAESDSALAE